MHQTSHELAQFGGFVERKVSISKLGRIFRALKESSFPSKPRLGRDYPLFAGKRITQITKRQTSTPINGQIQVNLTHKKVMLPISVLISFRAFELFRSIDRRFRLCR